MLLLLWYVFLIDTPSRLYAAIQRGLPNIATYLRVVLKREKLSEEAESLRMRYDAILGNLEQGLFPSFGRRFSVEDDGGYFSGNRVRSKYLFFCLLSLSLSLSLSLLFLSFSVFLHVLFCFCACLFMDKYAGGTCLLEITYSADTCFPSDTSWCFI